MALTQFHHISPNIFQTSIDLLLHKFRRDDENVLHAKRVLCREARCRRKRITTMRSQNPLIGFKAS